VSADLPAGVALREATDSDLHFLLVLYSSTREEEMRLVPWSPEEKAVFLSRQFEAQHRHYRNAYPGASWEIVEIDGAPGGRLYVDRREEEIELIDVALLPTCRGRGVGTALLRRLLREADAKRQSVLLWVEPGNPAHRLYERHGFRRVSETALYAEMRRPAKEAG
jgi:ribosomal protein S18 acetylase RimI-like enzyme